MTVGLTSSNYTGSEGSGFITAQVSFSRNLANPIVLTFHPVTYSVYQSTVGPLPDGFVIPAKGFEASGEQLFYLLDESSGHTKRTPYCNLDNFGCPKQ